LDSYLEVMAKITKTSRLSGRRRCPLPIVCHTFGLHSAKWATQWLRARRRLRLHAATNGTLMPACGLDWIVHDSVQITTTSCATMLKAILRDYGVAPEEAATYSAQSIKATFLAMLAKGGFDKSERRILGYHSKPGDRMVNLYSRNEQAVPLNHLGHMLWWIRAKQFLPDATKSGRWTQGKPPAPAAALQPQPVTSPSTLYLSTDATLAANNCQLDTLAVTHACVPALPASGPVGAPPTLGKPTRKAETCPDDNSEQEQDLEQQEEFEE